MVKEFKNRNIFYSATWEAYELFKSKNQNIKLNLLNLLSSHQNNVS